MNPIAQYMALLTPEERQNIRNWIVPAPTSELVAHAPAMGFKPVGPFQLDTASQTQALLKAWDLPPDLPKAGQVQVIAFPPGADVPLVLISRTDRTPTDARSGKLYMVEFAEPHPANEDVPGAVPAP